MSKPLIFIAGFLLVFQGVSAQPGADTSSSGLNQLTIFIIPSKVRYDWTSPSTLYKSLKKNYIRNLLNRDAYLLGHAFMELSTPQVPGIIAAGMRSGSRKEQKKLLRKDHYGLAILGADLEGKLENQADLEKTTKKYSKRGQLAFMTFFINDEATDRMIRFFRSYIAGIDSNGSAGARYGGAFWPRYQGEGSGCSAFVISFLDIAGLLVEEFDEWKVGISIPMELIGGPYNENNEVRLRDVRKHKSWADDPAIEISGQEYLEIYDPFLLYEWINVKFDQRKIGDDLPVIPLYLNKSKGIMIDSRNQALPEEDCIFMERPRPSIFIDYYRKNSRSGN
jgi:hypothetical protein